MDKTEAIEKIESSPVHTLTKMLIGTAVSFAASHYAGKAYDKIAVAALTRSEDTSE